MKRVALLAAGLACGCYGLDAKFTLSIDSTFTPQEICLTSEAARRWAVATGGTVEITPHEGVSTDPSTWDVSNHTAFKGYDSDARERGRTLDALGYTETIPGGKMWIFVDRIADYHPERYAQTFLYIQMHELGHHLGLHHIAPHTLMNEAYTPWSWDGRGEPCITQTDVDAFCDLYGCSVIAPPCELEPKAVDVCGLPVLGSDP
jgi:matrixin